MTKPKTKSNIQPYRENKNLCGKNNNFYGLSEKDKKVMTRFWSFGIETVGVVVIFGFFGYKADQHFTTLPWFTLSGIGMAITGMVYQFIKELGKID